MCMNLNVNGIWMVIGGAGEAVAIWIEISTGEFEMPVIMDQLISYSDCEPYRTILQSVDHCGLPVLVSCLLCGKCFTQRPETSQTFKHFTHSLGTRTLQRPSIKLWEIFLQENNTLTVAIHYIFSSGPRCKLCSGELLSALTTFANVTFFIFIWWCP